MKLSKLMSEMTTFQKVALLLAAIFMAVVLIFWRKDVEYQRCYKLFESGGAKNQDFVNSRCGDLIRNAAGI